MKNIKRIGVLTSGGDAPGMNAAVRAVVRTALTRGVEVMGIHRGYSGLIDCDIQPMQMRDVSNIINKGGTILYSDRCPEFKQKEVRAKAIENCKKLGIEGIVCIGGDGTFQGATKLTEEGIPCIGIPATIDNDITSTDNTIGFDSAMNTVIELVDKLRDTCESHARCNVVEVMGRGAGDIALNTAIALGASAVVVPEFPHDDNNICKRIKKAKELGKRSFIVIVSEGVGSEYAEALAKKIQADTGVETKFARLAHIVRGGHPTLRDRILSSKMGVYAVEELLRGGSNKVICERNGDICAVSIKYSHVIDGMYKERLEEGDLDGFTPEEIERMKIEIEEKKHELLSLYTVQNKINL